MTLMKSLVIVSATFFAASLAHASQCLPPRTPEAIAKTTQVAFIGTVVSVQESSQSFPGGCWPRTKETPECGSKLVTLDVSESLRGQLGSRATVVSQDACYCLGSYWRTGLTYLIVAKPNATKGPAEFVAEDVCHGTGVLHEESDPVLKALRESKPATQ